MSAVAFSQQGTLFFSKSLRYNDKYELRYSFEQDNGKTCCVLAPNKAIYKNTDLIYVDILDSNMQVLSHKALNLKLVVRTNKPNLVVLYSNKYWLAQLKGWFHQDR